MLHGGGRARHDGVIGSQAGGRIDGVGVAATKQNGAFGARAEEGTAALEDIQTLEAGGERWVQFQVDVSSAGSEVDEQRSGDVRVNG